MLQSPQRHPSRVLFHCLRNRSRSELFQPSSRSFSPLLSPISGFPTDPGHNPDNHIPSHSFCHTLATASSSISTAVPDPNELFFPPDPSLLFPAPLSGLGRPYVIHERESGATQVTLSAPVSTGEICTANDRLLISFPSLSFPFSSSGIPSFPISHHSHGTLCTSPITLLSPKPYRPGN